MCGIIAAFNNKTKTQPVNNWILSQFQDQMNRGEKGLGVIFINKKLKINIERATEKTKTILDLMLRPSSNIIMHHRFPTSSDNKIKQTHPILVNNKKLKHKYYVIHNGVILNEELLKKHHEKLGYKYTTLKKTKEASWRDNTKIITTEEFNDSESFAIEIARLIDKNIKKIKTKGSFAFIALQINKKTKKATNIYFGRNEESPLMFHRAKHQIQISSEGTGISIKTNKLYEMNINTLKVKQIKTIKTKPLENTKTKKDWGYNEYYEANTQYYNKNNNKNKTQTKLIISKIDDAKEQTNKQTKLIKIEKDDYPKGEIVEKDTTEEYETENDQTEIQIANITEKAKKDIDEEIDYIMEILNEQRFMEGMTAEEAIGTIIESMKELITKTYNECQKLYEEQKIEESYQKNLIN